MHALIDRNLARRRLEQPANAASLCQITMRNVRLKAVCISAELRKSAGRRHNYMIIGHRLQHGFTAKLMWRKSHRRWAVKFKVDGTMPYPSCLATSTTDSMAMLMPDKSPRNPTTHCRPRLRQTTRRHCRRSSSAPSRPKQCTLISHLSDADQSQCSSRCRSRTRRRLVDDLPEAQAAQMIERLSTEEAAAIVSELPSNEQADVIARLSVAEASAILDAMPVG